MNSTYQTDTMEHDDFMEKNQDVQMIESEPSSAKDVEASVPGMVMGVIPVGEINMTEDERAIVSLSRMRKSVDLGRANSICTPQHKRTNLKMDLFILPILSLLYLMNGLDRSNIGNASVGVF